MSMQQAAGGRGASGAAPVNELVYAVSGKYLAAFDLASGEPVWMTTLKLGWFSGGGIASIAVLGDALVIGKDGRVLTYNRLDGTLLWENRLEGHAAYATIVAGASSDAAIIGAASASQAAAATSAMMFTAAAGSAAASS